MKLTTGGVWSGIGSKTVCLSFLAMGVLAAMSPARVTPTLVDQAAVQADGPAAVRSFPLKYVEGTTLFTRLNLGQQEFRFRKEPDFGWNDRVLRQALRVGTGDDDYLGFAVNLTTRTLYLDLNMNLDLTDDPQGVYHSAVLTGVNVPIAYFRGVRLALHKDGVGRSYLLEPFSYLNGTGNVGIRSCYQAEVDVGGRVWLFQVQDNLDGRFDAQDKFQLTGIVRPGMPKAISYVAMPFLQELFVGGRAYRVKAAFEAGAGNAPATVTFEEASRPMSTLALEGRFVRRLVLLQGNSRLVVLDDPEQTTRLPAGDYTIQNAYLQTAPGQPVLTATAGASHLAAPAGSSGKLRIGPPFVSLVAAERKGSMLQMRYILRGAAGEEYTVSNPDRNNAPKFEVYLEDRVIANGSFQFG